MVNEFFLHAIEVIILALSALILHINTPVTKKASPCFIFNSVTNHDVIDVVKFLTNTRSSAEIIVEKLPKSCLEIVLALATIFNFFLELLSFQLSGKCH